MELSLDPTECRIVGSLLEKQMATPAAYPLSLQALHAACNQKSNRDPVVAYELFEIEGALRSLVLKGWVASTDLHGRVLKWRHRVDERLGLDPTAKAVFCELLLRGPQQPGELRARIERLVGSAPGTAEGLQAALESLMTRVPPLVARLPRRPGERADRYGHLAGVPGPAPAGTVGPAREPEAHAAPPARDPLQELLARVDALDREVARLRDRIEGMDR
jgi:uncharacterized protein YceH (UPF0502 family)